MPSKSSVKANPFKRERKTPNTTSGKNPNLIGKSRPTKNEKLNCYIGYLNGLDDVDLLVVGNTTPATLEKWKLEFNDQKTSALMKLRLSSLEIVVTDKEINEHKDYITNLRSLKTQHESEIESLSNIVNALQKITLKLEAHPDFESLDFKQVCAALKSYAEAKDARSKVQADYIKCCDTLNTETGITPHRKAGANKINEIAKAEGRLEIARQRRDEDLLTSTERRKDSFFDV